MIEWMKDRRAVLALLFVTVTVLFNEGSAVAQTATPSPTPAPASTRKVATPEQKVFQSEMSQYRSQREAWRLKARAALNAEMDREKRGDCRAAQSTVAVEQCLSTEIKSTQENYTVFAKAIRAMLALSVPTMSGQSPSSGPTGTPATPNDNVTEFDKLEAESKQYREHATTAAYNQYKGGTAAPVAEAEAEQRLLRLHLQEIAFLYDALLQNR